MDILIHFNNCGVLHYKLFLFVKSSVYTEYDKDCKPLERKTPVRLSTKDITTILVMSFLPKTATIAEKLESAFVKGAAFKKSTSFSAIELTLMV